MDLDGDGVISMYEMEYFYEEMVQRMESLGIETLPFEDCLCQVSVVDIFLSIVLNVKRSEKRKETKNTCSSLKILQLILVI